LELSRADCKIPSRLSKKGKPAATPISWFDSAHHEASQVAGPAVVVMFLVPGDDDHCSRGVLRGAAALCEREGACFWGVSLCGPMVFAEPVTGTIASNRPAPKAPRPRALGYANAADGKGRRPLVYLMCGRWSPLMSADA